MDTFVPLNAVSPRTARSIGSIAIAACLVTAAMTVAALVWVSGAGKLPGRDEALLAAHALGAIACLARAILIPHDRRLWAFVALGAVAWTAAWSDWAVTGGPTNTETIGKADLMWAAGYPGWLAAMWLLARRSSKRRGTGMWLDGLLGALAVAALTAATVLEAQHGRGGWSAPSLFFPFLDTVLVGMLATALAGSGWRLSRSGTVLGAGVCLIVIGDSIHAMVCAWDIYVPGRPYEALWGLGILALGAAAWAPSGTSGNRIVPRHLSLAFPTGFAAVALGTIVWAGLANLNAVAIVLAGAALALVVVRLLVTLHETAALADSRRLALTDEVTGAANRRALLTAARAAVEREEPFALLMLDLDRFKELNDTLGHQAGDEALRAVSRRLDGLVGPRDSVGRLGGDEFGLVITGATRAEAEAVATAVRDALAEPLSLEGMRIGIGASVGIALHPEHADDVSGLLRRADVAMYEAKRAKAAFRVYAAEEDGHSRDRLRLAGELGPAIDRGELMLRYQPVASFAAAGVTSLEALVRWNHPERGELAPGAFLPAVQHTALMRRLTSWVLDRALTDAATWPADRGIAVNVTPEDVLDPAFAGSVAVLLERHGVAAHRLTLEVTETTVLADPARASVTLGELRELGVRVALDDFGTGYSSLTHLQRMPVDVVKIDRSFVDALGSDRAARAIVRSTVVLAHALGATVVAEGAETVRTVQLARDSGCDAVQGYALARPLELTDVGAACEEIADGMRRPPVRIVAPATRRPADAAPGRRTSLSA